MRSGREVYSLRSSWGQAYISRRTAQRYPQNLSSAGSEAPNYPKQAGNRASERDSSSAVPARRGGLKYAPREIVDHRGSPPAVAVEEEKSVPLRESE